MKRIFSLILACLLLGALVLAFGSCGKKNVTVENDVAVEIVVKDYGTITLELYPKIAPKTVENFVNLAKAGFYDGLIFHRVILGFMIQGGDPLGNGTGGSDNKIKGEFSANGVTNNLNHTRGVISMARGSSAYEQYIQMGYPESIFSADQLAALRQGYDSASSQFFIVHKDSPHLNGYYAAFGQVTAGMEVVDAIAAVETNSSDKPLVDVVIETIRVVE
ncbi:MAG: peptidylprolyl isomerase [Clostridia bacterium]|nr:peptidylprolyl isomerase [Clostridia bacterium]MDY6185065.1 peptidylprolyl isomerase [Eubacteriales bacterium]